MKHIMCVHLRQWGIDRVSRRLRKSGEAGHRRQNLPLVLIETVASRQLVVDASQLARNRGVRAGMTLAEARALCPGLVDVPHESRRDRHALEALARWMMRFSPIVCPAYAEGSGESCGIFLDVGGCQRLFGGLGNLMEQVDEAMRRMRVQARLAIAPTPGAAWAVAAFGKQNGSIISREQLAEALAPLPPIALRIPADVAESLYHLGLERIEQLTQIPRDALPSRFGPQLLHRLDQAMGMIAEPLTPLEYSAPIEAGIEFDGVMDSLEAIWVVFRNLIGQIIRELARRGCGARRMELEFLCADAPSIHRTILLSRPSREPGNLFNLMRCSLDGIGSGVSARGKKLVAKQNWRASEAHLQSRGFVGIRLKVPVFERIADEQISLLEQEEHDGKVELDHLIERLVLRLGEEAVGKARLVEAYVPEKAYTVDCGTGSGGHSSVRLKDEGRRMNGSSFILHHSSFLSRPLHLLNRPVEVGVMVTPSHDRDGRPISISHEGRAFRIVHAIGPERIAGQWWEGHGKTRDYFTVEHETGRRWWVFRVMETGKWYLHGEFE